MVCSTHAAIFALRVVVWLLAARALPSARAQQELIAGGQTADARAFPWHVGVYRLVDRVTGAHAQDCGGTLISSRIVVSAAHCFWDDSIGRPISASRYKVAAGKAARDWSFEEADGQRMPVAAIAMPRRYRGRRRFTQHDIALLLLSGDILATDAVGFAQVDWQGQWDAEQLVPNSKGVVAGWGITEEDRASDRLRFVELPYVDPDVCFDSLSSDLQPWMTSDKFCAGYAGSNMSVCPGDSGGGLVFGGLAEPHVGRRLLRGVVSVAFKPAGNTDACYAQHYAGFTHVTGDGLLALARGLPDEHRIALLRLAHAAPADFAHAPDVGFLKLHPELRNFGDAWAECVHEGARLAVIDSEPKRRALAELLAANPGFGNRAYAAFVGAHRFFKGAVFASLDGSPLGNASFVRWQDGQPDGGVDGVERCVVMHARTALLHDDRCERLLGAICEIPLRPSTENLS